VKGRRVFGVRQAAVLLAVVLVVALILAGKPLHASAEDASSPALRVVAGGLTAPFAAVGSLLHADGLRQRLMDGGDASSDGGEQVASSVGSNGGAARSSLPATDAVGAGSGTAGGDGVAPPDSTTSTSLEKQRFDTDHPLRILVVGDSLVGSVGKSLVRTSGSQPVKVDSHYKISSGLALPTFFDWPAQARKFVRAFKPDVTVMMFGSNDHLGIRVDGKVLSIFSAAWKAEYQRRVEEVADVAAAAGSRVIFIGMPIMRDEELSKTARTLNPIFSKVCVDNGYWYVDTYKLFSNKSGEYAAYLLDSSGKVRLMREADGTHLTAAGGDEVAARIIKLLKKHYVLESAPPS
jgi:lysophospholipase L1-like esterase